MTALTKSPVQDRYTGFSDVVVSVSQFGKVAGLVQAGGWGLKPEARAPIRSPDGVWLEFFEVLD